MCRRRLDATGFYGKLTRNRANYACTKWLVGSRRGEKHWSVNSDKKWMGNFWDFSKSLLFALILLCENTIFNENYLIYSRMGVEAYSMSCCSSASCCWIFGELVSGRGEHDQTLGYRRQQLDTLKGGSRLGRCFVNSKQILFRNFNSSLTCSSGFLTESDVILLSFLCEISFLSTFEHIKASEQLYNKTCRRKINSNLKF